MNKKLKGRIVEKFGTISKFADAIDVSRTSVGLWIKGVSKPTPKHVAKMCVLLDIKDTEVLEYLPNFFK